MGDGFGEALLAGANQDLQREDKGPVCKGPAPAACCVNLAIQTQVKAKDLDCPPFLCLLRPTHSLPPSLGSVGSASMLRGQQNQDKGAFCIWISPPIPRLPPSCFQTACLNSGSNAYSQGDFGLVL